jgi:hypothetical protein
MELKMDIDVFLLKNIPELYNELYVELEFCLGPIMVKLESTGLVCGVFVPPLLLLLDSIPYDSEMSAITFDLFTIAN